MSVYAGPADWWTDGTNDGRTHIATKGVVQSGLVLNLDAGVSSSYPGSGTTWTDLSGNNNNGTLTNGPTFSSGNGGSIVFDNTDDGIALGNTSTFISASQSTITLNTWLRTNVYFAYRKILYAGQKNASSIGGLYFSIGPSPYNLYLGVITSAGDQSAVYNQNISTTVYSNICGTYDGSNIKLYLNGSLVATQPQTGNIINTGIMRISGYDNNVECWNGNISGFQIYNRALSSTEISQNFNALRGRFGI